MLKSYGIFDLMDLMVLGSFLFVCYLCYVIDKVVSLILVWVFLLCDFIISN